MRAAGGNQFQIMEQLPEVKAGVPISKIIKGVTKTQFLRGVAINQSFDVTAKDYPKWKSLISTREPGKFTARKQPSGMVRLWRIHSYGKVMPESARSISAKFRWKHGATRGDGKVFWGYKHPGKSGEYWVTKEMFARWKAKRAERKAKPEIIEKERERSAKRRAAIKTQNTQ